MDLKLIEPDRTLDTLGLLCPLPITKTQQVMRDLDDGEILEVLSDDTGILVDMPAWCKGNGNTYMGYNEVADRGHFELYIKKRSR